jgi:hypothetical protein
LKAFIEKIPKQYQQDHRAEVVRFKAWLLPSDHAPFKEAYCLLKIKPYHFFETLEIATLSDP